MSCLITLIPYDKFSRAVWPSWFLIPKKSIEHRQRYAALESGGLQGSDICLVQAHLVVESLLFEKQGLQRKNIGTFSGTVLRIYGGMQELHIT